jgi:hypothetical protein
MALRVLDSTYDHIRKIVAYIIHIHATSHPQSEFANQQHGQREYVCVGNHALG